MTHSHPHLSHPLSHSLTPTLLSHTYSDKDPLNPLYNAFADRSTHTYIRRQSQFPSQDANLTLPWVTYKETVIAPTRYHPHSTHNPLISHPHTHTSPHLYLTPIHTLIPPHSYPSPPYTLPLTPPHSHTHALYLHIHTHTPPYTLIPPHTHTYPPIHTHTPPYTLIPSPPPPHTLIYAPPPPPASPVAGHILTSTGKGGQPSPSKYLPPYGGIYGTLPQGM